jgi:hypothetical protein
VYRIAIPHTYLIIGNETRASGMLGSFYPDIPARRPLEDLVPVDADAVTLWGGEPTLRNDLLEIIRRVPHPGMRTDGMALGSAPPVVALRQAGLERVRISFHSGRSDANDWLTGIPGSAKAAFRAIRACADAGIAVDVDVCLTRPTTRHLAETAELLARLPVQRVFLRAAGPADFRPEHIVMLAPRIVAAAESVAAAAPVMRAVGIDVFVHGFAMCAVDQSIHDLPFDGPREKCDRCPGFDVCRGVSTAYADVYGWDEFGGPAILPAIIRFDAGESSRAIRIRMNKVAQQKPELLRIANAFSHAKAAELIQDAGRLSIPRVEISGDADGLARISDGELAHFAGITRVEVVAPPDRVDEARRQKERVESLIRVPCECAFSATIAPSPTK